MVILNIPVLVYYGHSYIIHNNCYFVSVFRLQGGLLPLFRSKTAGLLRAPGFGRIWVSDQGLKCLGFRGLGA